MVIWQWNRALKKDAKEGVAILTLLFSIAEGTSFERVSK
jgi:hypothetical protein